MSDAREEAQRLSSQAESLPYGLVKVSLLEEAVQLADTCEDVELSYNLRAELMDAANFSGRADLLLVTFAWCRATFDRFPGKFPQRTFLWRYKWIVSQGMSFPEISLANIEDLYADFDRRCEANGYSRYSYYKLRRNRAVHMGDRDRAREMHAQFRKQRRDSLSDCPACVANSNCDYFSFLRQWKRSVQAAQPVLSRNLTCAEEPHRTLAIVLMPLFRLGQFDEAKTCQRRGYQLIQGRTQFVFEQAQHLRFQVLMGDLVSATRMVERNLPSALAIAHPSERFEFLLAAHFWAKRLLDRGTRSLKVRLPDELPPAAENGTRDLAECSEWFLAQAQEIARRFDRRNGTDRYQEDIDSVMELLALTLD